MNAVLAQSAMQFVHYINNPLRLVDDITPSYCFL